MSLEAIVGVGAGVMVCVVGMIVLGVGQDGLRSPEPDRPLVWWGRVLIVSGTFVILVAIAQ